MKTLIISICCAFMAIVSFGQNKDIDNIFNKFDGKNGVTSINITKDMMELAAMADSGDLKIKDLIAQISGVKILVLDEAMPEDKVSFNNMVKSLSLTDYKELMVVKEKDTHIKMLSKDVKGKIQEFLLLVTGGDSQVLVRIEGNIDPKLLGKLSKCVNMKGCEYLAKLDKK